MREIIKSYNLDANETAFFARELESLKSRSYDIEYPELKATRVIPVSTDAGPGAESITYQQFDSFGMAKIIANYADDLPRADIRGKEFTSPIKSIAVSYGYNFQEIRSAQLVGRPLQQRIANAARLSVEQKINQIAFFGDEETGLKGLLNHENVTRVAVAQGAANGNPTEWVSKTPSEILKDLNNLANGIVDRTNGVETPNTILMPIDQYTHITSTARSDNSDTTILQYFLTNNPYITTVDTLIELKGGGEGAGAVDAGSDAMIAYNNSPDKLTLEIPQPFEQFGVQERELEFIVPTHARIGGVIIYYPLSIAIGEGI